MVPEEHVIVLYDRALFDDKAYISDEEFRQVLARFGLTEQQALSPLRYRPAPRLLRQGRGVCL